MNDKEDGEKYRLLQAEELMKQAAFYELDEWWERWGNLAEFNDLIAHIQKERKRLLGSKVGLAQGPITKERLPLVRQELDGIRAAQLAKSQMTGGEL
jgi:hypothetical protein